MFGGERYDYCDLAINLFLKGDTSREVYLFYDIACKYGKNFKVNDLILGCKYVTY
jgi:hypothetical protein